MITLCPATALRRGTLVLLALGILVLLGCHRKQVGNVEKPKISFGWTFTPDSAERTAIREDLRPLCNPERMNYCGEVRKFGGAGANRRYLILRDEGGQTPGSPIWTFYVLKPGAPPGERISRPFDTGVVAHPWYLESLGMTDWDGDSLPDFTYCTWRPEQEARAKAVGYRETWYEIPLDDSVSTRCQAYGS